MLAEDRHDLLYLLKWLRYDVVGYECVKIGLERSNKIGWEEMKRPTRGEQQLLRAID